MTSKSVKGDGLTKTATKSKAEIISATILKRKKEEAERKVQKKVHMEFLDFMDYINDEDPMMNYDIESDG